MGDEDWNSPGFHINIIEKADRWDEKNKWNNQPGDNVVM